MLSKKLKQQQFYQKLKESVEKLRESTARKFTGRLKKRTVQSVQDGKIFNKK